MEMSDYLMLIVWTLWGLTIPAYPIVQIIALLRSSGMSRWIAGAFALGAGVTLVFRQAPLNTKTI